MDLILHIGTEKTGTTSVQNFFHANRKRFAERGILYPLAPGPRNHVGLAIAAQEVSKRDPLRKVALLKTDEQVRKYRAKLLEDIAEEMGARHFDLAVMSNEHTSSRLLEDGEVAWLRDELKKLFSNVKVVVYLRRQDDFLLSTYSTSVKSGGQQKLALPPEHKVELRYDHWHLLERWARVFGRENIVCRRFERSALKDGDVVEDFLDVAGIESTPDLERPEKVNESLDGETLEYLRLFNRHVPRFKKGELNPLRGNIIAILPNLSAGPLLTLSDADLAHFMGLFADSNRRVAEEYFGGARAGSDDALFERRNDTRERVHQTPLTVERAVELGALLWQEKQEQVNRLADKARKNKGATRQLKQKRRRPRSEDA